MTSVIFSSLYEGSAVNGSIDVGTADNRVIELIAHMEDDPGATQQLAAPTIGGVALIFQEAIETPGAGHAERYSLDSAAFQALSGSQTLAVGGDVSQWGFTVYIVDEATVRSSTSVTDDSFNTDTDFVIPSVLVGDLLVISHQHRIGGQAVSGDNGLVEIEDDKIDVAGDNFRVSLYSKAITADATDDLFTINVTSGTGTGDKLGFGTVFLENAAAAETTGTVAATLGNATSAASGQLAEVGNVDSLLDPAVGDASGQLNEVGTVAVTLQDVISTASGQLVGAAFAAITLENATSIAAGQLTEVGMVAAILAPVTSAASGTNIPIVGTSNKTLQPSQSNASGSRSTAATNNGTAAPVLDSVVPLASASVGQNGILSVTLGPTGVVANGQNASLSELSVNDATPDWESYLELTATQGLGATPSVLAFDNGDVVNRAFLDASLGSDANIQLSSGMFALGGLLPNIRPGQTLSVWLEDDSQGRLTKSTTLTITADDEITGVVSEGYSANANLYTMFGSGAASGDYYLTQTTAGSLQGVDGSGLYSTPDRGNGTSVNTRVYDELVGVWRGDVKAVDFVRPSDVDLFLNTQIPGYVFEFQATLTGIALPGGPIKRLMISSGDYLDAKEGATDTVADFQPKRLDWTKASRLAHTRLDVIYTVYATNGINDTAVLPIRFVPPGPPPNGEISEYNFGPLPEDRINLPANSVVPLGASEGDEVLTCVSLGAMAFNGAFAPIHITTPATLDTTYFDLDLDEWSIVKRDFLSPQGSLNSLVFDLETTAREGWALITLGPDLDVGALDGLQDNDVIEYNTYGGTLSISSTGVPTHAGTYGRMAEFDRHDGVDWEELTAYVPGTVSLRADLETTAREGWILVTLADTLSAGSLPNLLAGKIVEYKDDAGLFTIGVDGVGVYLGDETGKVLPYEIYDDANAEWDAYEFVTNPATGGVVNNTLEDVTSQLLAAVGVNAIGAPEILGVVSTSQGFVGGGPGQANVTLDSVLATATGTKGSNGDSAGTLDAVTASITGRYENANTLNETLNNVLVYAAGTFNQIIRTGTSESTLDEAVPASLGNVIPFVGRSDAQPGSVRSTSSGGVGVNGSALIVLSLPESTAEGIARGAVAGAIDLVLGEVESNTSGVVAERAVIANSIVEYDVEYLMANSFAEIEFITEPILREGVV